MTGHLAHRQLAFCDFGDQSRVHLEFAVEFRLQSALSGIFFRQGRGCLHLADGRMSGAAFGGIGEQRDAGPRAQKLAGQLRGGNGDVRQLLDGRIRDDTAVSHEHHPALAEPGILDLHDHATGGGCLLRGDLDDLKQGPQHTAGNLVRPGNQTVGLVHRHHHGAEIIRLEHRLAGLALLDGFVPA